MLHFNMLASTVPLPPEPTYSDPRNKELLVVTATFHCIYDFTTQPRETVPRYNEHFQKRRTVTTNTSNPFTVKGGRMRSFEAWKHVQTGCTARLLIIAFTPSRCELPLPCKVGKSQQLLHRYQAITVRNFVLFQPKRHIKRNFAALSAQAADAAAVMARHATVVCASR